MNDVPLTIFVSSFFMLEYMLDCTTHSLPLETYSDQPPTRFKMSLLMAGELAQSDMQFNAHIKFYKTWHKPQFLFLAPPSMRAAFCGREGAGQACVSTYSQTPQVLSLALPLNARRFLWQKNSQSRHPSQQLNVLFGIHTFSTHVHALRCIPCPPSQYANARSV
jgi:hypothetical protein